MPIANNKTTTKQQQNNNKTTTKQQQNNNKTTTKQQPPTTANNKTITANNINRQ
jgi:hypothetical protein